MSINWKLLIEVRERQKRRALEGVTRDRQATEEGLAQVQQAQARAQMTVAAKTQHWEATAGALGGGACNVAALRQAGAWSHALDAQIAQAGQAVAQAQALSAERQAVLDASRQKLRAATGELEKAQQMQQRSKAQHLHQLDLRHDDAAEETASQAWSARRLS